VVLNADSGNSSVTEFLTKNISWQHWIMERQVSTEQMVVAVIVATLCCGKPDYYPLHMF